MITWLKSVSKSKQNKKKVFFFNCLKTTTFFDLKHLEIIKIFYSLKHKLSKYNAFINFKNKSTLKNLLVEQFN